MNQELMDGRQQRGLEIAQKSDIRREGLNTYIVPSQYGSGTYKVDFGEFQPTCTCPDCQTRHIKCKHQYAVEYFLKFEKDKLGNMTVTQMKRVSYPQNWSAYTKAQTSEIELFDNLLRDLVQSVEEPIGGEEDGLT
ncbi:MAG: SWIM zinc finger family protein [Candidatus Altiarchaeota archaeon]|nr:SWIM zinc finger family protein [Candidatus Altiarchaeota archaeon]